MLILSLVSWFCVDVPGNLPVDAGSGFADIVNVAICNRYNPALFPLSGLCDPVYCPEERPHCPKLCRIRLIEAGLLTADVSRESFKAADRGRNARCDARRSTELSRGGRERLEVRACSAVMVG